MMVCVVDIDDKGMMSLGSEFGILEGRYTRAELVPCGESFMNIDDIPDSHISMWDLARKESNGTGQGFSNDHAGVHVKEIMFCVIPSAI